MNPLSAFQYIFISLVCLHEAVVTATVGAIVAPTGCSRRQPALSTQLK